MNHREYRDFLDSVVENPTKELLQKYNLRPDVSCYVGAGWVPILDKMFAELFKAGWDGKLGQVKSKFCTLRVYIDGETNHQIGRIIAEAEDQCNTSCERCGAPHGLSVPRTGMALCSKCKEML